MVTENVMKILQKIYKDIEEFIDLVGLEYTEDDEYVCNNTDQVDDEWCDREMLVSISTAYDDIDYFLPEKSK